MRVILDGKSSRIRFDLPLLNGRDLYRSVQAQLGVAPILPSHEHEIDPSRLIGLRGAYCAYFSRTLVSPEEKSIFIIIGNTDSFRLYLNGKRIAEEEESLSWSPFNNVYPCTLKKGVNQLLIKLLNLKTAMDRGDLTQFAGRE